MPTLVYSFTLVMLLEAHGLSLHVPSGAASMSYSWRFRRLSRRVKVSSAAEKHHVPGSSI